MDQEKFKSQAYRLIVIICMPILLFIGFALFFNFCDHFTTNVSVLNNLFTPALGLIATILTYTVFVFQNEFNKKQELVQHTNSIDGFIKETIDLINDIEWNNKRGVIAIREFKWNEEGVVHTFYDELYSILIRIVDIETLIEKIEDVEIQKVYYKRLYTLFYSKLLWNINKSYFDGDIPQAENIIVLHDDSPLSIELYIKLSDKCLTYLISNHLSANSDYKRQLLFKLRSFLEKHRLLIESRKL